MPQLIQPQRALYESLRQGDATAFACLYPLLHRRVASFVLKQGGQPDDVTNTLHECIIATLFNIQYDRYVWTEEAELTTYMLAIARNIWLATRRAQSRFVVADGNPIADLPDDVDETQAEYLLFETQRRAAELALQSLDDKCRRTLELYYWEKLSMAEVAQQQGWANEAVARKSKANCLQKLRERVSNLLNQSSR